MFYKRCAAVFLCIILGFGVVIARLFTLAIKEGDSIAITAQQQQQYLFTLDKKRGTLYDRNDQPLTYTGSKYCALVQPARLEDEASVVRTLALVTEFSEEELRQKIQTQRPFSLSLHWAVEEQPGLQVFRLFSRSGDRLAVHLLGTVSEKENQGLSGLEKALDGTLSRQGELYASAAVDAKRREIPGAGINIISDCYYSENGVRLTLDREVQKIAEQAANNLPGAGAVVVAEVETGDILAMVSRPSFLPQSLESYLNSDKGELLNRSLLSYNLGSIFKIVVSAAAYETDSLLVNRVYCDGGITVGGRRFGCHLASGHGGLDLKHAFMESCNPYFISQGLKTGLDPILDMAEKFGLKEPITLCEGLSTAQPLLPPHYGSEKPSSLLVANTSIGQGDILVSPLHALQIINTVATGGIYRPLRLVDSIVTDGKAEAYGEAGEERRVLQPETAQWLQELMQATMEDGTGRTAKPETTSGGGKTASAETGQKKDGEDVVQAWFGGYFPETQPRYSIIVFSENGKSGAAACSPVFKEIADEMLNLGF